MAGLRYAKGDRVDFKGECGHTLVVEDIRFYGPTGPGSRIIEDDSTATYYLRCEERCSKRYEWRTTYASPRPRRQ